MAARLIWVSGVVFTADENSLSPAIELWVFNDFNASEGTICRVFCDPYSGSLRVLAYYSLGVPTLPKICFLGCLMAFAICFPSRSNYSRNFLCLSIIGSTTTLAYECCLEKTSSCSDLSPGPSSSTLSAFTWITLS